MQNCILAYFNRFLVLALFILLLSPVNSNELFGKPQFKNDIDSLQSMVQQCPTDTAKFKVLYSFFWIHYDADFNHAKPVGEWAFNVIRNSKNLKACADGYDIKGFILNDEGKLDSAYFCYERALNLSTEIGYKYRMAWCCYNLAWISSSLGNHVKAIKLMKTSISLFEQQKVFYNEVLSVKLLAGAYQSRYMYDSAIFYYNKKLEVTKRLNDKFSEISTYLQLASLYKTQYNNQEVVFNLNQAIQTADRYKQENISVYVYEDIGDFFSMQKENYGLALQYYKKGLENCYKSKNKEIEAIINNSIANLYIEKGNDSLAMAYNQKSLRLANELDHRHYKSTAYKTFGLIYKNLGKYQLALDNYNKCFEIGCKVCPKIAFHGALIASGDLCLKLDNKKESFVFYTKAIDIAESFHSKPEIALSQLKIGNFYRYGHQLQMAEKYYLLSMKNAKAANDINLIKNCADTLSNYFYQRNNFLESRKYLQIARVLEDSIYKMASKASISDLQLRFEFEEAQKVKDENELKAKQEIKQQKTYRNFFLTISILLALLGLAIFIGYRRIKIGNKLLTLQKEEIEWISKQLHEADQSKLRFFANVSHELRTPLTLIISPLARLLKENVNERYQKVFALMLRNSRKLQDLINQLLDISKIDKTELKLNVKRHDFNRQVKVIAAMFETVAEEKNIEFIITSSDENLVFCFDAERMEQIVNNLLSNAFKFTPQFGKIEISTTSENDNAILKIRDNGIGIPSESLEKVFDRFYQTDATLTRHFEGSGIGLALTKELVELHHGIINVKSEIGKWTEFTVLIPLVQNESNAITEKSHSGLFIDDIPYLRTTKGKKGHSRSKETILLVEDNNDLRSYINEILSLDYNVLEATNGTEGIEIAIKEIPDIVISDVMMPETDGYQLTSKIKGHLETSHIPIILLTAKAGRDSKIEGLERGADDYINKPFDEEELLLKVKNILYNRQMLQAKYKKQLSPNPSEIKEHSMDEQFIVKLVTIIEKDLSNPALDVDYLSSNIGLSRQQLYRKLKAITGLTPVEFIRSIRIKRAAQLIKQKAASVGEIAFMTGFENLSYFSKRFKEEFGQLPSDYGKT